LVSAAFCLGEHDQLIDDGMRTQVGIGGNRGEQECAEAEAITSESSPLLSSPLLSSPLSLSPSLPPRLLIR